MKLFYPALITSAVFFGAIAVNLHDRNYSTTIFLSLLAIPAVLLQVFLSQKNFDFVGYLLILVPIVIVYVGYSLGIPPSPSPLVELKKEIKKAPETSSSSTPNLAPSTFFSTTSSVTTATTTTAPTTGTSTTSTPPANNVPERIESKMS